jgi:hypothetical protein
MPLRVELAGHPGTSRWIEVTEVGDAVLGPAEVRRLLGPQVGDAVPIDGPVVVVRAELPADAFEARGRALAVHDGMAARAEVPLETERVVYALFPALEGALGGGPS